MALKLKSLMAVQPSDQLDRRYSHVAGLASVVLSILAVGGLLALVMARTQPMEVGVVQVAYAALFALAAAAGVNLMRGCLWSQRLLLMFWLANAILWVVLALAAMLWRVPAWWSTLVGAPFAAVLVPALVLSAGAAALLVLASTQASRSRYGTMVIVSVAAAAALVLAINMIVQADPIHRDVESLGQYGLSKRTIKILDSVNEPIQMTVVYTSLEENKKGADFRQSVLELGEEMRQELARRNKQFTLLNITSDEERAQVKARLQQQSLQGAPAHKKLLYDFLAAAPGLLDKLKKNQDAWEALSDDSYAGLWGLNADMPASLQKAQEAVKKLQTETKKDLSGADVPNMARLIKNLSDALKRVSESLDSAATELAKIAKVPGFVAANRAEAVKAINSSHDAVKAMVAELGKVDDPVPADPTTVIKNFNAGARKAEELLSETAAKLHDIAGKEDADLMGECLIWGVRVPDPDTGLPMRGTFGDLYTLIANSIGSWSVRGTDALTRQVEYQRQFVVNARKALASMSTSLDEQAKGVTGPIDKLAKLEDEESKRLLAPADGRKPLADIVEPIKSFVDRADKLPDIKESTLSQDVRTGNIVLLEVGGKSEVVTFDAVWPLRSRSWDIKPDSAEANKRIFNGDSAIGSKILSMTQKPFGTVLLTYYQAQLPPQMMQRMPPQQSIIPVEELNALRSRLEEANFKVVEWNLSGEMPPDADEKPTTSAASGPASQRTPKVLLLLPPPFKPAMPYGQMPPEMDFGEAQLRKVRDEINAGAPAIFLAGYFPRTFSMRGMIPRDYPYNSILRDWGVNMNTDYRLIAASPDETERGKFRLDIIRSSYLPLSWFTDHPIGKPIQAQRVLWRDVCPVDIDEKAKPKDVTVQPLLTAPASMTNIWAVSDIRRLVDPSGGLLTPDFNTAENPDRRTPLTLAVAAVRTGDTAAKPNRIVALGVGESMVDGYLNEQVPELKSGGLYSNSDPPRADADLVVNSVYWLIARHEFIAAGPSQIKPVEMMSPIKLSVLWAIYVIGLPIIVLVVGGVVFARRRS